MVSVIPALYLMIYTGLSRQVGSWGTTSNGNRSCLHADLVPEPGVDEAIESLKAPFDDERLDTLLTEVGDELREGSLAGEYDTLGIGAVPMADGELRMLTGIGGMAYQDGILVGT